MKATIIRPLNALRLATVVLLSIASTADAGDDLLLNAVFITGSSRYSAADLVECYAERLGQPVTKRLLDGVANDVQARYRRDGLVAPIVVAMDAESSSTTPRLHVFEAAIKEIVVRGDVGPYVDMIMNRAHQLQAVGIDKQRTQAYLRELNDLPGLNVRARFEPRDTAPNEFVLVLDTSYKAVAASLSFSNRGTPELGRTLLSGRATLNGALGTHSALSLYGATSDQPDRYRTVGSGLEWNFGDARARVDVADTRARFDNDYEYHSQRAWFGLYKSALRTEQLHVEGFFGFAARDAEGAYPDEVVSDVDTRVAEIGVLARQSGPKASGYARLGFARGTDLFGASVVTRNNYVPQLVFDKATLDMAYMRSLSRNWLVRVDGEGQWSDANLPSGERFSFGGSVLGRAFDPGELVGETGGALSVQLEYVHRWQGAWLRQSSVYAQSDYGYARDRYYGSDDAASMTAGIKGTFSSLLASLELSMPINQSLERSSDGGPRVFANMQMRF
jgi:hemolysin activation/secretion protein